MLTLKFLDIGLGTSTFIKTDNLNIIFDCGQNSETGKNAFDELNGGALNYLILTHPHKDHIEALISKKYINPNRLTRNKNIPQHLIDGQIKKAKTNYDKEIFLKYKKLNNEFTESVNYDQSYINPKNNGDVDIHIFTPNNITSDELNDYSLATYLSYKGYKILLMGDNTPSNIDELLDNKEFKAKIKNVDVLLAPHHGRESCYSQELMNHVNPKITIISDKPEDNDESASNKYSANSRGMTIIRNGNSVFRSCITTRNDGDITVTIDNNNLSISCIK